MFRMLKKPITLIGLFIVCLSLFAQLKPIGSWTDHLPYNEGTSLTTDGTNIYVGTTTGLFVYNEADGSISRYSKVNRLNGIDVGKLKFNPHNGVLVIVYSDGNIDLLKGNQTINIPFISQNSTIVDKGINDIQFFNETALLSFNFGIVELNTDRNEIKDTYRFFINNNSLEINSAYLFNNRYYAATKSGIYFANSTSNLLDQNAWSEMTEKQDENIKAVFALNNTLYFVVEEAANDNVYRLSNNSLIQVSEINNKRFAGYHLEANKLHWFTHGGYFEYNNNLAVVNSISKSGNGFKGLVKSHNHIYFLNGWTPLEQFKNNSFAAGLRPNGPEDKDVTSIESNNGILWTTNGGFDGAYNSSFRTIVLNRLRDGKWTTYRSGKPAELQDLFDPMSVTFDPNKEGTAYIGTFGRALIKVDENLNFQKIDDSNSSIQQRQDVVWDWTGVPDVEFDENGNMWVTNTYTENCLSARINGNWQRFNLAIRDTLTNSTAVTELIITESGIKWIAIPRANQILVFDDRGTYNNPNDDRKIVLTSQQGRGNLPGIKGITMEKDQKGQIWIGTSDGLVVYFSPDDVFQKGRRDAQRILIEGSENVEVLLAGTDIKDIAVDGANRKWIATENSGVYLISEDGEETIHHFTEDNSPLFSNTVLSIGIDDETGEVYFGTSNGLISFRGTATEGAEDFSEVKVFPNPVRESYQGPIAISGLINNSTVKITDINGYLVNELRSTGGQAVWDGTTFKGERASTGVYFIFNSANNSEESLKTHVAKVLLIN